MPRLPRLTVPVFQDLAVQLRYAPEEAIRRAIDRAEQLAGDIDLRGQYPAEWVVYRVSGYRPDNASTAAAANIDGDKVLADLSAFVERLCTAAGVREADLAPDAVAGVKQRPFVTADDLAKRWNISRKTIDRLRRRGLVARRVIGARGKAKILFNSTIADAFARRNSALIERAAGFSRIDPAIEARIVRRAARYRRRFGCSLNEAAKRLATRFDRSHEAIRQLLRRHDRRARGSAITADRQGSAHAVFGDDRPIDARDRRLAYRAYRRAIEPAEISERLGHGKAAVTRAVLLERLDRLRVVLPELDGHTGPMFPRPDAASVLLRPAPITQGLGRSAAADLATFLSKTRARTVPVGAEESARAIAYQFLIWRARQGIQGINHLHPSAQGIDRIETDLRWAARLKVELVHAQLPLMLQTLEGRLGSSLDSLRPADARGIIIAGITSVSEAVHIFDPFRAAGSGARLAGSVSPAITRLAAQLARQHTAKPTPARATAIFSGAVLIPDWTTNLCQWQTWVEPDARVKRTVLGVDTPYRDFLCDRFGWAGGPPHTLAEVAQARKLTAMQAGMRERRALREILDSARASAAGAPSPM